MGLNPTGDITRFCPEYCFIAQSPSQPPFHLPDMTEILLKKDINLLNHPSMAKSYLMKRLPFIKGSNSCEFWCSITS